MYVRQYGTVAGGGIDMRIIYFIITSSLMICLMLLFRRLFRNKLSANVIYGLWLLVFFRLLVPFGYWEVPVFDTTVEIVYRPMAVAEQFFKEQESESLPVYEEIQNIEENMITPAVSKEHSITPKAVIFSIWFTGALSVTGYVIVQNRKLRNKIDEMDVIEQIDSIDICTSKDIRTPCLFGLRNPKIIVTEEVMTNPTLYEYAIIHELEHYHHKDHIYNADKIIMCILYWWNPLVWYAAKCVTEDAELACDERVLKNKSKEECKKYGYALLQMMEHAQHNPLCMATSYFSGKNTAKQRIESITRRTITKKYILFPVVLLLMVVLAMGCVYPSEKIYIQTNVSDDWNNLANSWAKAFVDKNVEIITNLATENASQQLIDHAILDEDRATFGWSSPWPVFTDEHYRIVYCDSKGAEILYYATDSTPHVYVWKEKLEFTTVQNETKVFSWSLKRYDVISEHEEYINAYPKNQISNTSMDYFTNGLGETLNKNALLSSSTAYQSLFNSGTAALELLNISKDDSLVHYNVEEMGEKSMVHITFLDGSGLQDMVDVTMWQPYGKDGIWIPKDNGFPTIDEYNEKYKHTNSNATNLIKQADDRLRDGYTEVKLTYVDNAEVGWDYYIDNPWKSDEERDALSQAALKELYTLTGFNVKECTYTTDGRSKFIFGKSAEYIGKSIAFYTRDYGFTLCGDGTPYIGFMNARRVHYSDVQQLDSPYGKKEFSGHAAISTWFLEHSGLYQGEKIKGYDTFNLDDTVFTHIKLLFDGGYYVVVIDEDIESVHNIMGPYYE